MNAEAILHKIVIAWDETQMRNLNEALEEARCLLGLRKDLRIHVIEPGKSPAEIIRRQTER